MQPVFQFLDQFIRNLFKINRPRLNSSLNKESRLPAPKRRKAAALDGMKIKAISISSQFLPARCKTPRRCGHSSRSFEWWVYSNKLWWGPAWWPQIQSCQGCFFLQVIEYLLNHYRVFSAIAPGIALPPTYMDPLRLAR